MHAWPVVFNSLPVGRRVTHGRQVRRRAASNSPSVRRSSTGPLCTMHACVIDGRPGIAALRARADAATPDRRSMGSTPAGRLSRADISPTRRAADLLMASRPADVRWGGDVRSAGRRATTTSTRTVGGRLVRGGRYILVTYVQITSGFSRRFDLTYQYPVCCACAAAD